MGGGDLVPECLSSLVPIQKLRISLIYQKFYAQYIQFKEGWTAIVVGPTRSLPEPGS